MAQLIQVVILLTAPSIATWDMANGSSQYPKIPERGLSAKTIGTDSGELVLPESHAAAQQNRIEQMGVHGVIYFDAPLANSQSRIIR